MKAFRWVLLLAFVTTGCATSGGKSETRLWFAEQTHAVDSSNHKREVTIPVSNLKLLVDPHPVLTQRDVAEAELVQTAGGNAVLVKFDPHGTVKLDEVTTRDRGQYLVVFLDDKPLVAWLVDRRLSLGQFLIEADVNEAKARELVEGLNQAAKRYHSGSTVLSPW